MRRILLVQLRSVHVAQPWGQIRGIFHVIYKRTWQNADDIDGVVDWVRC